MSAPTDSRPRSTTDPATSLGRAPGTSGAGVDPLGSFRLDGQVAIVTGASSGLGAHFARVLHAVGATVVVTARRVDRLDQLADELPGAAAIVADMARESDRERLVAEVLSRYGRVDVLVNNAGVGGTVAVDMRSSIGSGPRWRSTSRRCGTCRSCVRRR